MKTLEILYLVFWQHQHHALYTPRAVVTASFRSPPCSRQRPDLPQPPPHPKEVEGGAARGSGPPQSSPATEREMVEVLGLLWGRGSRA